MKTLKYLLLLYFMPFFLSAQNTMVDVIVNSNIHNTLEAAVVAADLAGTLSGEGPFTVFAPTDDAFAALPPGTVDALLADPSGALTDILLYHVLPANVPSGNLMDGQLATTINGNDVLISITPDGVFVNNAQVIVVDVPADNGVVHVIDAVLIPPTTTVVDIIVNSDVHNTLEAAVIAADLAGTLSGEGPFTVFAPTDDAFAALPDGVLDALLADPSGALTDILLYHVIAGNIQSGDLTDGQMATTINGQDVTVTINSDGIFINDAQVIIADIPADNGVVHVIDAVLVPAPPTTTVVDIIVNSDVHNTLEAAVIAADLAGTLSGEGPFTVFAPTDDAFAALPDGVLDALLADPSGDLTDILLYHVIAGNVQSGDLTDGQMATTINGQDVTVTINSDGIFINDAQVIIADIPADNGVVHVIDAVLIPTPTTVVDIIVNSDVHNTLEAAVIAADLAGTLSGEGPFTVFAPTDDAFAALPDGVLDALLADPSGDLTDILLYHVIAGNVQSGDLTDGQMATTINGEDVTVTINSDGIFINDAQVIIADIPADNGVVHVIDAVLIPTPPTPTTVVDIIVNSDVHNTLEAAVIAADLAETLSGEGPFTVFAPTDDAFAALPDGLLDALLADPSGDLTSILLYHVLGAEVLSGDLFNGQMATTVLGQDVTVTINDNGIFINDAQVIIADIPADNGVVHVIDAVLVPELNPEPGIARVQFIHDAEFETIRVFADGEQIENFLAYKTATDYIDVPSGNNVQIELRSRKSYQPADPVFAELTLEADKTYVIGIVGTFDTSDNIPVELVSFDRAIETAPDGQVGVQLLHGSYDAPTIDIVSNEVSIFDDVSYGEFGEDFLLLPEGNGYRIDVTTADNSVTVASYELNIEFWKRKSLTIFATGSLTEGTFQPWVALSTGGTYPLPEWTGFIANSLTTNATVSGKISIEMTASPNPAGNYTMLEFETGGELPVRLDLINGMGQILRTKELGTLDAGTYIEEVPLTDLKDGLYFIRAYIDGNWETTSIIKSN